MQGSFLYLLSPQKPQPNKKLKNKTRKIKKLDYPRAINSCIKILSVAASERELFKSVSFIET